MKRRQAEYRKSLQGRLANEIVREGNIILTEDISYRGLQKNYGKSVGFRAPGMFIRRLGAKIEAAGGIVIKFATKTTALSQVCQCGRRKKKPLSKRWHRCSCGVDCQRDLYSAFLARHVDLDKNDKWALNFISAKIEWNNVKPLLDEAVRQAKTTYFYKPIASLGF